MSVINIIVSLVVCIALGQTLLPRDGTSFPTLEGLFFSINNCFHVSEN